VQQHINVGFLFRAALFFLKVMLLKEDVRAETKMVTFPHSEIKRQTDFALSLLICTRRHTQAHKYIECVVAQVSKAVRCAIRQKEV
jgi:hypothetical protein